MNIRCLLVDDEESAATNLQELITTLCPEVEICGIVHSATDALRFVKKEKIDLLFLDVEMPGASGFEFLNWVGEERNFRVIFTTAYDHYAIKAIRFSALDFLLKPISKTDLIESVKKAIASKRTETDYNRQLHELQENVRNNGSRSRITIVMHDNIILLEKEDIVHIVADTNYSNIVLRNGEKVFVSKTLKEFETLLTADGFFRAHKSHLVNLRYIKKVVKADGGYIIMDDGTEIMLAHRRRNDLLKIISQPNKSTIH